MWKFVIIPIFASLAASPLQITPEELRAHFDAYQIEIHQIQKYYIAFWYYPTWTNIEERLEYVKLNLTSQMLTRIAPYQDAMDEIFKKFTYYDSNVLECLQAVNKKHRNINDDILITTINNITAAIDQSLEKNFDYVVTMDDGFNEMEKDILECNDSTCATDLYAALDQIYLNEESELIDIALELNNLINEGIDEIHLDVAYYDAQIQSLIEELQLCTN